MGYVPTNPLPADPRAIALLVDISVGGALESLRASPECAVIERLSIDATKPLKPQLTFHSLVKPSYIVEILTAQGDPIHIQAIPGGYLWS